MRNPKQPIKTRPNITEEFVESFPPQEGEITSSDVVSLEFLVSAISLQFKSAKTTT